MRISIQLMPGTRVGRGDPGKLGRIMPMGLLRLCAAIALLVLGFPSGVAKADDWDMYLCVDNFFDAYFGNNTATVGLIGSGNSFNTTYHFTVPGRSPSDYLYVVGVSDHLTEQGFVGVFTNTTNGRTVHTSSVLWQVFPAGAHAATNPFFPSPWPPATMPTQAQVNTAINYATTNNLWITPSDPPGEVNDGTVFGGLRTNIPVSANWIWHNTGLGPNPGNPLHGGFNHNEFLVFRLQGAVNKQQVILGAQAPGTFLDISTTGTPLNLNDDDEAVITTTIGNPIFPAGTVVVANNGGLGFPGVPGENDLAPNNAPIPSNTAFNGRQSAIVFWDDLKGEDLTASRAAAPRGGKNGNVFWQQVGTKLVVQWNDRPVSGAAARGPSDTVSFQIQIFDGVAIAPGAQYAQFIYGDVSQPAPNGGASATIGYQGGISGVSDFQWSFNNPGVVFNGSVLTASSPLAPSEPNPNAIPAVSDAGRVVMVLLLLTAGIFLFKQGRSGARLAN